MAKLDAKSGASLKLSLLNKSGRIWMMVAGGGASIIYALVPSNVINSDLMYVAELYAKSGASLKLTVLNKTGHIWTMVAGGGASVIIEPVHVISNNVAF